MGSINALRLELTSGLGPASRRWMRLLEEALGNHGVSAACAAPLVLIGRSGGGINQVALADQLGLVGPSLVRLLDQLCDAELLRREEDRTDRRAKTLWLTPTGEALAAKFEARLIKLRIEVFGALSTEDLKATLRVHRALAQCAAALADTERKVK